MEVVAVLDLGNVRVTKAFEVQLDDRLLLLGRHGEGDVVDEPLRESPGALLQIGLVMQVDGLLRAAFVDVKADVRA